ncbi:MAG TPA: DegQ family serine endoprotease [Candidatus Binatia bacterium]|nr:DegQ family serine endoprotease [Candidatus Binatia bacterium]
MKRIAFTLAPLLVAAAFAQSAPVAADVPPALLGSTPTLAPMLKTVLPGVVNISISGHMQVENPLMQDPFFRHFFGVPDQDDEPQQQEFAAAGSGVIVDAGKGYILTNHHVVEQAEKIQVTLNDGRTFDGKLVGSDPPSDLAVVQIKADKLTALNFFDSDRLQVGDFVVAVGNPFGIGQTVTSGIVSALGRSGLGSLTGRGYENFIQTDAAINPGNSGGALLTLRGELVGINSQIVSRTGTSAGIGFAIPANQAQFVLKQIVEHGSVERGRIGVGGQDLTPELAKAFGLPVARGVLVTQVVSGSPAAKAGIKREDILVEANGRELRDFQTLRNLVGVMKVGDSVDLKVLRDGKPLNVRVTIGKDTEQASSGGKLHPGLAGAQFAPADESNAADEAERGGIAVRRVAPRSPAARNGLRTGDVIIAVNRKRVATMEQFEKLAGDGEKALLLLVRRGNNAFFVTID